MKSPVRVAVTGAAGQISYSLLFRIAAGEMLGPILCSLHNLRHFQRLLLDIRRVIAEDSWSSLVGLWPVLENSVDSLPAEGPNSVPALDDGNI